MRRTNESLLWDYFKPSLGKYAVCKICFRELSYRTTTGNLKIHMKRKHPAAFADFNKRFSIEKQNRPPVGVELAARPTTEENEGPSIKFSSEIWRRFEVEDDEGRCTICQEAVPAAIEDMKGHLEEHHSQVLDDIIAKAQKSLDSDTDAEDDNVYTEVVYLEDEPKPRKSKQKERPSPILYQYSPKPAEKNEKQDDLEVFINYIRSLLKKVPKELTGKLQLDIINLIINAQNAQDNNFQNGGQSSSVITVPIQSLVTQDKVMLPNLFVNSSGIASTIASTSSNTETVITTIDSQ